MSTTKSTYNQITKQYSKTVNSDDLDHPFIEKFLVMLKPGDKVLDAGCGTGNITYEMQKYHKLKVTGIDFSEEMIKTGKNKFRGVNLRIMDIRHLSFKKKRLNKE